MSRFGANQHSRIECPGITIIKKPLKLPPSEIGLNVPIEEHSEERVFLPPHETVDGHSFFPGLTEMLFIIYYLSIPDDLKEAVLNMYGGWINFSIDKTTRLIKVSIVNGINERCDFHHIIPQRVFKKETNQKKQRNKPKVEELLHRSIYKHLQTFPNEDAMQGHFLLNLLPVVRSTHEMIEERGFDADGDCIDILLKGIPLHKIFLNFTFYFILEQEKRMLDSIREYDAKVSDLKSKIATPKRRRKFNQQAELIMSIIAEISLVLQNKENILKDPDYQRVALWLNRSREFLSIEQ